MPVLISPGASCTSLGSRCSGGSDCITAIGADAGPSCVSRAADNAPCNDIYGPRCSSPARCTDGRCVLPDYTQCK
jgi:hypothetical protein